MHFDIKRGFNLRWRIWIERFSTANHMKENITGAKENWKWKQANCLKRGKTRVTKSRLIEVLNLIGWESGASFLDQSQNEVKQKQSNPGFLWTFTWKLL